MTVLAAFAVAGSLRATLAVSNLAQPDATFTLAVGKSTPAFDFQEGISFTTGTGVFNLEGVTLSFFSRNGNASGYTVALYTGLTAAGPTGLVTTFTGNPTPSTGLETYLPLAPTTLLGGTTYWLVESAVSTPSLTGFSRVGTLSPAEDPGGLSGWSIADTRMVTNNGGASWLSVAPTGGVLKFSVQAAPVPDAGPGLALLAVAIAGLVALRSSGRHSLRSGTRLF